MEAATRTAEAPAPSEEAAAREAEDRSAEDQAAVDHTEAFTEADRMVADRMVAVEATSEVTDKHYSSSVRTSAFSILSISFIDLR